MRVRATTAGFTAVELLVTLFVAAAFLMIGYQLFNLIIRDGGDTRAESAAGNVAYEYLRRYSDSATNPCTPSDPLVGEATSVEGAAEATVSISITCEQGDAPTLSKVESIVAYTIGTETKTARFSTYVDKSTSVVPASDQDITNGLIGWWKLNESANSSAGPFHGVSHTTTPAVGQNGQGAHAFAFNGTTSRIAIPTINMARPTNAFTVTAWVYPTGSLTTTQGIVSNTGGGGGGWSLASGTPCTSGIRFNVAVPPSGSYVGVCSTTGTLVANQWNFVAGTFSVSGSTGTVRILFSNSAGTSTTSASTTTPNTTMYWHASDFPMCIGGLVTGGGFCSSNLFNGRIDDVRYYSTALSVANLQEMFNRGAR